MHKPKTSPVRYPATATFLSEEKREKGTDPPIPIQRTAEVWTDFEALAAKTVRHTIEELPLGRLCHQLNERRLPIVRSPWTVRDILVGDQEHVRDIMQDVALAMVQAIHRGAIAAARPVVYVWIKKTARRVAREKSRLPALSLLTGVYLSEGPDNDDNPGPQTPPPLAGISGHPLAAAEELEDVLDVRTRLRDVVLASTPANLTDAQELVLLRHAQGASHQQIAGELGISEGAVRLRLMKARRKLKAA